MQLSKLSDWLQVISGLGIVAGLVLVAFELDQNTKMAQSEASTGFATSFQTIDGAVIGDKLADALATASSRPDALSLAEMYVIDRYLFMVTDHFGRLYSQKSIGVINFDPDILIEAVVPTYFGSKFAQAWWSENKEHFPDRGTIEAIERGMVAVTTDRDSEYFRRIRGRTIGFKSGHSEKSLSTGR